MGRAVGGTGADGHRAGDARRRWYAFWPGLIMAFAIAVGLRDLISLAGGRSVGLSTPSLVLGVWAAVVAVVAGAMEIAVCWREDLPERAFVAPALLVAGGVTVCAPLLAAVRDGGSLQLAGVLSGLLIIAAGALLAAGRLGPVQHGLVRYAWPVALGLGAVSGRGPAQPPDPFVEARREIAGLEAAWHQRGFRVARTDSAALAGGMALMMRYRVQASDVYVYLIAHDTTPPPEGHLEPRLVIPPPSHGVPHLHRSSHLTVVCITKDWRFAQQLDELVRGLADTELRRGRPPVGRVARVG